MGFLYFVCNVFFGECCLGYIIVSRVVFFFFLLFGIIIIIVGYFIFELVLIRGGFYLIMVCVFIIFLLYFNGSFVEFWIFLFRFCFFNLGDCLIVFNVGGFCRDNL